MTVKQGTIADQIDELRGMVKDIAFLQVTATPLFAISPARGLRTDVERRELCIQTQASCVHRAPPHS